MTDSKEVEAVLTEAGRKGHEAFDPEGPWRKNIPVSLEPGGIHEAFSLIDVSQYYQMTRGTYKVRCLYQEGPVQVWSNTLSIEVQ